MHMLDLSKFNQIEIPAYGGPNSQEFENHT